MNPCFRRSVSVRGCGVPGRRQRVGTRPAGRMVRRHGRSVGGVPARLRALADDALRPRSVRVLSGDLLAANDPRRVCGGRVVSGDQGYAVVRGRNGRLGRFTGDSLMSRASCSRCRGDPARQGIRAGVACCWGCSAAGAARANVVGVGNAVLGNTRVTGGDARAVGAASPCSGQWCDAGGGRWADVGGVGGDGTARRGTRGWRRR